MSSDTIFPLAVDPLAHWSGSLSICNAPISEKTKQGEVLNIFFEDTGSTPNLYPAKGHALVSHGKQLLSSNIEVK